MRDTCTNHFEPQRFNRVGRGCVVRSKYGPKLPPFAPICPILHRILTFPDPPYQPGQKFLVYTAHARSRSLAPNIFSCPSRAEESDLSVLGNRQYIFPLFYSSKFSDVSPTALLLPGSTAASLSQPALNVIVSPKRGRFF